MAAAKKKSEDKSLSILRELITHDGNKYCFDCSQRGPTYVNMTIGSFVCSKCSGMLRGLTPPHRVKSISMASFTPEEIEQIKSQGNDYCSSIWLGLANGSLPALKDEQSIKEFMSQKYEQKRFYYMNPNAAKKQNKESEKPIASVAANKPIKENNIWIASPVSSNNVKQFSPHKQFNISQHVPNTNSVPLSAAFPNVNIQPSTTIPSFQEFPVDFTTADIFNSSQINNNVVQPNQSFQFNQFDLKNSNTVSQDRYAALADLDLALRQQCQSQETVENKPNSSNPFNLPPASKPSKNPFYQTVNGNDSFFSNPFSTGFNTAQTEHSTNPFL